MADSPVSPLFTPGRLEDIEVEVLGLRKVIKMQEEQLKLMYDEMAVREENLRKALASKAAMQGRLDACLNEAEVVKGKVWKVEQEKSTLMEQLDRGRQELEELRGKVAVAEKEGQRVVGTWKERLEKERGANAKREEALALEAEHARAENKRVEEKAQAQVGV